MAGPLTEKPFIVTRIRGTDSRHMLACHKCKWPVVGLQCQTGTPKLFHVDTYTP